MVLLAFSLQDQVEKYGAYVGIASFFGLAVLSLLYFAQAREVRRLRDWAGRAPERAQELEERVAAQADAVRPGAAPAGAPPPPRGGPGARARAGAGGARRRTGRRRGSRAGPGARAPARRYAAGGAS